MPAKHEVTWPGVETTPYRLPLEEELISRVSWLIALRWVAAAALIILTLIAKHLLSLTIPWVELCLIGAAILAYNCVFTWLLRVLRSNHGASIQTFSHFAARQILLDWLALTLVVHYTGGIESPALSYFIFNSIVASILLPARVAFLLAAFGVLLVMGLALLEFWEIIPHLAIPEFHDPRLPGPLFLVAGLGFFVSAILVSIYLATSITKEMVRRTRELAELKQHLEDAYQKMRTLYETSRAVSSSLNLSQVLSTIVRQATEGMRVKASSIRLLDEDRRFLEVSAAYGLSDAYLTKGKVDPQRGEMDRLTLQGKPVDLLDATVDPRFQYPEEARKEGIRSVLSVPMMLLDRAIGVLRVYTGEVRHFTKEETEFLTALASQGATAIQNARAFRQLDVALVAWIVLCLVLGGLIAYDIHRVDKLATTLVTTTGALVQTSDALGLVGDIPFVGGGLKATVDGIKSKAQDAQAGALDTRTAIEHVSIYAGIAVAVIPAVLMLALYLPLRLSWRAAVAGVRRSLAANPDDRAVDEYLARRAIDGIPFDRLRSLSADPWQDLHAGRTRALADAELARMGLSRPQAA